MPVYEGADLKEILYSKNDISTIEATFSIVLEKDDTEIKGDGILHISREGNLNLRVYSFGFLALELTSEKGDIKSIPGIDSNKRTILTYGLRDCLFWWDIKDYEVNEEDGIYHLKNPLRNVWIDKKTMLPVKQTVSFEDGREISIFYGCPEKAGEFWYPSRIRVEVSRYSVTLKIKEISFMSV
ncbi:MAG: hypothetical protein AB1638_06010 [Nitrospirota bacterium]